MTKQILLPALLLIALLRPAVAGEPWGGADRGWPRVQIDPTSHEWPKLTNSSSHWFAKPEGSTINNSAVREPKPVAKLAAPRGLIERTTAQLSMAFDKQQPEEFSWIAAISIGWWSLAAFGAARSWVCGGR